jgi:hypothetical protein
MIDGGPPSEEERPREPGTELVRVMPGVARLAATAWYRTTVWSIQTSLRIGARLAGVALSPEDAGQILSRVGHGLRNYAREFLGIHDLDRMVREAAPGPASQMRTSARGQPRSLREQGAELLRESADLSAEDGDHPAFARILSELAPDEMRILRLLTTDGPQPTIDVRSSNLIGVGSLLVALVLNVVGSGAGRRHPDRVPMYLNNLHRLGLIWFPHEAIDDPMGYQVLEAQPDAMAAIKRAGRAKTVHRSVSLTAFGKDFCDVVLPRADARPAPVADAEAVDRDAPRPGTSRDPLKPSPSVSPSG